ncbi:uncharacterized protein LOC134546137 [Bacillus rossius redtenbacheri]|uniref:uncharacterized protein LOC134546137 n=1 Tax=Bacillus rossius redtenbacheri TaxID=93214 RepID=UPI002FDEFF5B
MAAPSVGWVYKCSKSELLQHFEDNGLVYEPSETVADLRARLVKFVRTSWDAASADSPLPAPVSPYCIDTGIPSLLARPLACVRASVRVKLFILNLGQGPPQLTSSKRIAAFLVPGVL